jgi:hypothetical protein
MTTTVPPTGVDVADDGQGKVDAAFRAGLFAVAAADGSRLITSQVIDAASKQQQVRAHDRLGSLRTGLRFGVERARR